MDTMVKGCLDYLDEGVSPFHAVEASARRLDAAGFTRLEPGGKPALEFGKGRQVLYHPQRLVFDRMADAS